MITLDFNKPLLNLYGKKQDVQLSTSMAEFLGTQTKGPAMKIFGWYNSVLKTGKIQLDAADLKMLIEILEPSEQVVNFAKGQLLQVLEKAGK